MFMKYFIVDPIQRRSLSTLVFRWSQLLGERTNGYYDLIFRILSKNITPIKHLSRSSRMSVEECTTCAKQLKFDGYSLSLCGLSKPELQELISFASSTPAYDNRRKAYSVSNINNLTNGPRIVWKTNDLIRVDIIKKLTADSAMVTIAQKYLGGQAKLALITMWLDTAHPETYDAHVYHFDNDGPGFLKFFYYINDIGTLNGPHRFIKGSHHPIKPTQFRSSKRYNETELLSFYGPQNEVIFEGIAGTAIAEDTRGFHRGTSVQEGNRIILQFEYSLIDIPMDEEFTDKIIKQKNPYLTQDIAPFVDKFFTQ